MGVSYLGKYDYTFSAYTYDKNTNTITLQEGALSLNLSNGKMTAASAGNDSAGNALNYEYPVYIGYHSGWLVDGTVISYVSPEIYTTYKDDTFTGGVNISDLSIWYQEGDVY